MENLPALNLKNLDKSQWKTYRFDEIAKNISERVDPNNTDLEVYVGLEHIDSESIHLKRSGTPDDVDGQKLRFYPGDVIFARRRAYQRKAAVATTHGFCSAHALVLRANSEVIHPQLFPFFMHSDAFMHKAVDISVGSLSPTINWGTLKHQSFFLPPFEYQEELAKSLWVIDDLVAQETKLLNSLETFYRVNIEKLVPKQNADYLFLGDIVTIRKGITYTSDDYATEGNGIPLLNLKSIERGGGFNVDGVKYYDGDYLDKHFVKNDDLIVACTDITRDGNVVGFPLHPSVYQNKKMLFTMDLIAIEVTNNSILRDYLYYVLKSRWVHYFMFARSPGTTVLHLDVTAIGKLKIPNINIDKQKNAIDFLKKVELSIDDCKAKIKNLRVLQKKLINQLF